MTKGILTGSKVVDVRVSVFDGTYHAVDSDEVSFKMQHHKHLERIYGSKTDAS